MCRGRLHCPCRVLVERCVVVQHILADSRFDLGLAFRRYDTTLGCKIRPEEAEVMNAPTFFFLYILPFVIAGTAWAAILFSDWYERRKARLHPGE